MAHPKSLDTLNEQLDALEEKFENTAQFAASFDSELQNIKTSFSEASKSAQGLERALNRGLRSAIDGVVLDGDTLSQSLKTIGQSLVKAAYNAAVKPVTSHVAGLFANGAQSLFGDALPFAKGGTFSQGRVTPFATGGIVDAPTYFPMRSGTGLMGEAGPEAIMPLSRGPDGKLGVKSQSQSAPVNVVMNISTPNAESFRRSQSQIAAQMSRALGRGQKLR